MFGTLDLSREVCEKVSSERAAGRGPKRLILGRLPVRRELPGADEAELAAVRAALADPRTAADRTLDRVVDRLLEELSW